MIQAYFNQIRKKIIEEINNSNKDIIIAVAWFTQHDLFDAIINALERGVNISLILIKDIIVVIMDLIFHYICKREENYVS